MAADILDEKRHATKRPAAERDLHQIDAVVIELDDGIDLRVDGRDRIGGNIRQLARSDLGALHKLGQAESVMAGIFVDSHVGTVALVVVA